MNLCSSFAFALAVSLSGSVALVQSIKANAAQSPSIVVESIKQIPSFSIAQEPSTKNLNVFVSPTCNYCERLVLDLFEGYKKQDRKLSGVKTTITLMPRSETDVSIISGLMCVNESARPQAIYSFYKHINRANGTSPIGRSVAMKAYVEIMDQAGIAEVKRKDCENSRIHRAATAEMYRIGASLRKRDVMPVILFNDKYIDLDLYRDLSWNIFSALKREME